MLLNPYRFAISSRLLSRIVTAGLQSTITFSSIPGTYEHLLLRLKLRDTIVTTETYARMKFNGDNNTANYTTAQYLVGVGAAVSVGTSIPNNTNGIFVVAHPGVQGNANAVTGATITFHNYADTLFHKTVMSRFYELTGTPSVASYHIGGVWKSTAAITNIVLTCGGTAFINGCIASLYGMA
jgi:hypothetical protein